MTSAKPPTGGQHRAAGMVPVDLHQLMVDGVLMAANERFFWPLGLALAWTYDSVKETATNLLVVEWPHAPGEGERIDLDSVDPVGEARRAAYDKWLAKRVADMRPEERPFHELGGVIKAAHVDADGVRVIDQVRLMEVSLVHTDAAPGTMDEGGAWALMRVKEGE